MTDKQDGLDALNALSVYVGADDELGNFYLKTLHQALTGDCGGVDKTCIDCPEWMGQKTCCGWKDKALTAPVVDVGGAPTQSQIRDALADLNELFRDKNPHFHVAHHLQARYLNKHKETIRTLLQSALDAQERGDE